MERDSHKYRMRAKQCRKLASDARDEQERETLNRMAEELEHEAASIDAASEAPERKAGRQ